MENSKGAGGSLKGIILDSSVWIAYLRLDDSLHKKADQLMHSHEEIHFFVPEYILLEVATILKQKVSALVAVDFVKEILNGGWATILPMNEWFRQTAKVFYENQKTDLSFVDCSLVALNSEYKVYTFDQKLKKALKK